MDSVRYVAQVKHVSRLSLAELERIAVEMDAEGRKRGKCGLVIVKRRAGRGCRTPRLVCMTAKMWRSVCARRLAVSL